jgi:hypothetical protein
MIFRKVFAAIVRSGLCALALAALTPTAAFAQANECNGLLNISYPSFTTTPIVPPPAVVDMQIDLGTGTITGSSNPPPNNNFLTVTTFQIQLACRGDAALIPTCVTDGPGKVDFIVGSETDNCPTHFTAVQTGNKVTFTAMPPGLVIPHDNDTLPYFCQVKFQMLVSAPSAQDGTPDVIEQTACFDQAHCDNGVLVAAVCQTSSIPVTTPTEDFDCYQADKALSATDPCMATGGTCKLDTLVDQFAMYDGVPVKGSQRLCAPAVKVTDEAQPVSLPTEHLAGYEIRGRIGSSTFPKGGFEDVHVHSAQFGDFTVDVTKIAGKAALLVPTMKSTDPNTPPPPFDEKKGHFLCYDLDNVTPKGAPGTVHVRDQFNPALPDPSQTVTFKKPDKGWRLCTPVNKNGFDPPAETSSDGLLCLVTGNDVNSPLPQDVSWSNQLQTATKVHLDKLDDFCATATITACGEFPRNTGNTVPPGSYLNSCANCSVSGCELSCVCARANQPANTCVSNPGACNPTSLDLAGCENGPDIVNVNGVLTCTPLP